MHNGFASRILIVVLSFAFMVLSAYAQGPIVPTNGPGLSMKTLDQVEARIPISSIPTVLNQPGSYYFTGSLSMTSAAHGIQISADQVTVDLNGYSLFGTTNATRSGIFVSGLRKNIVVKNGALAGWGWDGVDIYNSDNGRVEAIQVKDVGLTAIRLGFNGQANDCQVLGSRIGLYSFDACSARRCQVFNTRENGFELGTRAIVEDCQAFNCGTNGIYVGDESVVKNCHVVSNRVNGITLGNRCEASGNHANRNGLSGSGAHILCRGNQNLVERNQLNEISDAVIRARGSDNVIADNVVLDTLTTYDLSATNSINILIHKLPVTLSWPCSARLAGSLTGVDGIFIDSDGVTLDLGGHTLSGRGGTYGITLDDVNDVTIRNGVIRGWSGRGINGDNSQDCRVEQVKFVDNGMGLMLDNGARISQCEFYLNHQTGLYCNQGALVTECAAVENLDGIRVGMGSVVSRCVARSNNRDGILALAGSEVMECSATDNNTNGIRVAEGCIARNNSCALNRVGLSVESIGGSRIEDNNLAFNTVYGIQVYQPGNIITRNTARQNGSDYAIAVGNATGILVNVTAGGAIVTSNPWVNFSF
ncbi:MAG: hypothetical protein A2X46_19015 [Lentisphaerae bacterium GWF2_57_35]|nr:MAG: hypothetical protein A2X46_19015 [Lentisphaerae bacterium GWF2_57_35]